MKKIASAGSLVAVVALASMGVMGTAHATDTAGDTSQPPVINPHGNPPGDDTPPEVSPPTNTTPQTSTPQNNTVASTGVSDNNQVAAESESLPNTGGPNAMLLGGALALVAAGGATVVVARRRQTI